MYGRACILAYDPDKVLKDRWGRPRNGDLIFNWFNARQVIFKSAQTTEGRSQFSCSANGTVPSRNPKRVPASPKVIPPSVHKNDLAYLAADDHVLAVRQDLLAELAANECREFEEAYKRLRIASYLDLLDERAQAPGPRARPGPLEGPAACGRSFEMGATELGEMADDEASHLQQDRAAMPVDDAA